MSLSRYRRIVMDDDSEVFASSTATDGRYVVSRPLAGGTAAGIVTRRAPREWVVTTCDDVGVWSEATGRNWPTLRAACGALLTWIENSSPNQGTEVSDVR